MRLTLPDRSFGFTDLRMKRVVINDAAHTAARSLKLEHRKNARLPYLTVCHLCCKAMVHNARFGTEAPARHKLS